MSGDLSVGLQSGGTHLHGNDSADFASACALAGRRNRANGGDARPQNVSAPTDSSSSSDTDTTLPPGVSVDAAEDKVEDGAELITTPEPCTWTVDQRVAWHEKWLAKAEAFFNDPLAARYLTPEQLTQVKADLKSYREQLDAFKALLAKYRCEGKEPSKEEVRAAFGAMRELRNDLKENIAIVVGGVADSLVATFDTSLDATALMDAASLAGTITSYTTLFQSMLTESGNAELDEARSGRFLDALRNEFSRMRDARQHPVEQYRP